MSDTGESGVPSLGAFIRQAIGEGMGVTAAREAMRDLGVGALSNEVFGKLYGEVRSAIGAQQGLADIAYDAIPDASVYVPWSAGEPDRYASFVTVYAQEPGTRIVTSIKHVHVTDEPHTPQEALDAAMDTIRNATSDPGTDFKENALDGFVTSMTRTARR